MTAEQFDKRYTLEPRHVDNPGVRKRAAYVVHQMQESLSRVRHRPENIGYFQQCLAETSRSGKTPFIGIFCQMIPFELLDALNVRPIKLDCGNAALVQPGEEVLAGEICPLVKSSFGELLDPETRANNVAAFVLPSSCDGKRKLAEPLSDYKPTFVFNLPPEQDAGRYLKFSVAELERLVAFVSGITGVRLTRKRLLNAVRRGQRRTQIVRRLQDARAVNPEALSVRDFFLIIQASFSGESFETWYAEASAVLTKVEAYKPARKRLRPRLVLTGAPIVWPNFKILNLIEESGADVVADTLCTGAQSCFDPVMVDETGRKALLRMLALRYVFASPCPCFISQATRLSRVLDLVDEYQADGVVNNGLRLCQLFDIEAHRLSAILKEHKIPFINLRTDYSLEDTEQLRVRLEAFLETVEGL